MASLTTDQVIEALFESDDDGEVDDDEEEVAEGKDSKLEAWLASFPGPDGFNHELFRDLVKPVIRQCSVGCSGEDSQLNELEKAAKTLSLTNLNAGSILNQESILWMRKIHTRMAGRVAVRQPYHAKICRQIPHAVFTAARQVLLGNKTGSFMEPKLFICGNSKAEILCFTSLVSFQKFMTVISGLSTTEVKKYFSRKLNSRGREGHLVKLLVDQDKQLALTYWMRRGQLEITFEYGEWNASNYPFHSCQFNPEEF